ANRRCRVTAGRTTAQLNLFTLLMVVSATAHLLLRCLLLGAGPLHRLPSPVPRSSTYRALARAATRTRDSDEIIMQHRRSLLTSLRPPDRPTLHRPHTPDPPQRTLGWADRHR